MFKIRALIVSAIGFIAIGAATLAAGSASPNFFYQPQEPKNLKELLNKK